ncbi:MAG: TerC family protein [Afipia sp.]|nr:TerC family protein [Afipia sp.]
MAWLTQIFDLATYTSLLSQFQSEIRHPEFWVALTKIIWINVLLSGDNALVIALACRGLQPQQRVWGMILGAGVAVVLRIVFTFIVVTLMALPFLKLIGGLALVYIAAKLLVPEQQDEDGVETAAHLWAAVRIVAIADIIMSLDNVIAVAAAANGSAILLILGLAISIPMIVAGAAIIMALLDRLPILVWFGAALLGWIAGEVIATDPAVAPSLHRLLSGSVNLSIDTISQVFSFTRNLRFGSDLGEVTLGLLGIVVVLILGSIMRGRALREHGVHAKA